MIVISVLGGIGVIAVGLAVADLFGKGKIRRRVDDRAVDVAESRTGIPWTGEYIPPPDDGRPR